MFLFLYLIKIPSDLFYLRLKKSLNSLNFLLIFFILFLERLLFVLGSLSIFVNFQIYFHLTPLPLLTHLMKDLSFLYNKHNFFYNYLLLVLN